MDRSTARGPWGSLPDRVRILYVTASRKTGCWLAEALAVDGATQIEMNEAAGVAVALSRLRDEVFDVLLISHQPGELDALELVEGIRAGHPSQATIILGTQSEQEMAALCYEVGADGYACVNTATTRGLIWMVARAIEHHQLITENQRLKNADQFRLQQDHQEVGRLLQQQQALISNVEVVHSEEDPADEPSSSAEHLSSSRFTSLTHGKTNQNEHQNSIHLMPEALVTHYRELLRAYVIMGAGNLAEEMETLAKLLVDAGMTAQQTMQLHLEVLAELVDGLGTRSARHVMNRADVLVLDVLLHLVEGYRQRCLENLHPPRQQSLPGFENVIWGERARMEDCTVMITAIEKQHSYCTMCYCGQQAFYCKPTN